MESPWFITLLYDFSLETPKARTRRGTTLGQDLSGDTPLTVQDSSS